MWGGGGERDWQTGGSDVTIVTEIPCQKFALFVPPFTLPVSTFLNGHHCTAEIGNEFTLSVAKKNSHSLF